MKLSSLLPFTERHHVLELETTVPFQGGRKNSILFADGKPLAALFNGVPYICKKSSSNLNGKENFLVYTFFDGYVEDMYSKVIYTEEIDNFLI